MPRDKYKLSKANILQDPPQHYVLFLCVWGIRMLHVSASGLIMYWAAEDNISQESYTQELCCAGYPDAEIIEQC